jgi:hypothetical protein
MDHTQVKLAPGFVVSDVVTGFESRWIVIDRLPSNLSLVFLRNILESFGTVLQVKCLSKSRGVATAKAQFENAKAAMQAVGALNGSGQLGNTTVHFPVISSSSIWDDACIRLRWNPARKVAFAGYSSLAAAENAVKSARGACIRDSLISAAVYDGLPSISSFTVRFQGLSPRVTLKDLKKFGNPEAVMLGQPNYQSTAHSVSRIRSLVDGIGEVLAFEVTYPHQLEGMVQALVHFASHAQAKQACRKLHDRSQHFLGNEKLYAVHLKTLSQALPPDVYDLHESDIRTLCETSREKFPGTTATVSDQRTSTKHPCPVLLKISGENIRDIGRVKVAFERLLRGETVKEEGQAVWDGFFGTPSGSAYLQELNSLNPGVEIRRNLNRCTITLSGAKEKRDIVRLALLERIKHLRAQKLDVIGLEGNLLAFFMSSDLLELQREVGPENVMLNFAKHLLVVRGTEEVHKAARRAVELAKKSPLNKCRLNPANCPVCLSEPTAPITLRCGHSWCTSCLSSYLLASIDIKVFPLTCIGSQAKCSQPIPISVARSVLNAEQFDKLVQASFLAHVHSNSQEFHFCPTPDCMQVYRNAPRDVKLQCPSCLARICPKCHSEYHEDTKCEDCEDLFQQWAESHGVKNCPGCRSPIERNEGCNHITCVRCQTHMCWVCMKTFPKGEGIYDHMRSIHGGVYPD